MQESGLKYSRKACTKKGSPPVLSNGNYPQMCCQLMESHSYGDGTITFESEISDISINGGRLFAASFIVPALYGDGWVRFAPNYAPKLMTKVEFEFPTRDVYKVDRDQLISNCNYIKTVNRVSADLSLGNEYSRFVKRRGTNSQEKIHDFIKVTVPIHTVFDINNTNYLPMWRDQLADSPIVRITFTSIDKVLIYQENASFNFTNGRPIFPENVCLHYEAVNGASSIDRPIFIPFVSEVSEDVYFANTHGKKISISNFNSVSNISFFERPPVIQSRSKDNVDPRSRVSFPDGERPTPDDYMKNFVDAFVSDMVVYASPEQIRTKFPDNSVFVPVHDNLAFSRNEDNLWSINCKIFVENIPEGESDRQLYFHANVFWYKGHDTSNPPLPPMNVSNYFKCIRATYLRLEDRVRIDNVEHCIPTFLPSVPVLAWHSVNNNVENCFIKDSDSIVLVSGTGRSSVGDKRSSRSGDIIFNDPEFIGADFLGVNLLRVSSISIGKQSKYDEDEIERLKHSSAIAYPNPLNSTHPVIMLGNCYNNATYNFTFNNNIFTREEPTRLTAKKDVDQKSIIYEIVAPDFARNDPRREYAICTFVQKSCVFKLYTCIGGRIVLAEQDAAEYETAKNTLRSVKP